MKKEQYLDEFLQAPLNQEDINKLKNNSEDFLAGDQFNGYISFGTGGMRQMVDLGTNRLNLYNISKLNFAVAKFLTKDRAANTQPIIVVGCDTRNTSELFSWLTYHIFKSENFKVKIFKRPTPTPLISFAVRELNAQAGIILTASHNPPEYNGYKLMASNGAQIISPKDKEIQKEFTLYPYSGIPNEIHTWKDTPPLPNDVIEEEIIQAYLKRLKQESFISQKEKKINVLYSSLHGTGGWVFERIFSELGYKNFDILKEQCTYDGNFPSVKSPNPEDPASFELLRKNADKKELLIATDPDSDRIGCCAFNQNSKEKNKEERYTFLTGNQIGCLLLKHLAEKSSSPMRSPYICKTIVTTELQKKIAGYHNIRTIETLTGFKYIASIIENDPDNYLFGGEESFGYLPVSWVRDKDSISSGIVLAEIANEKNLLKELDEIYMRHGLYSEELFTIKLDEKSMDLPKRLKTEFNSMDAFLGRKFGNRKVIDYINLNYKDESYDHKKNASKPVTIEARKLYDSLPFANVLQIWLEPEGRVTIRPSGTEPKVKIYISLMHPEKVNSENMNSAKKSVKDEIKTISREFFKYLKLDLKTDS